MVALKGRQGAALAVVPEPAARTPERQALADAIAERDRRQALLTAKRREVDAAEPWSSPAADRKIALEAALAKAEQGNDVAARRDALLRGEAPAEDENPDALRDQIARETENIAEVRRLQGRLKDDVKLLESTVQLAEFDVKAAIDAIILADPATAAVVEEYRSLRYRAAMLARAIPSLTVHHPSTGPSLREPSGMAHGALPPCPWLVAVRQMHTDPDAPLPTPADVFGAVA